MPALPPSCLPNHSQRVLYCMCVLRTSLRYGKWALDFIFFVFCAGCKTRQPFLPPACRTIPKGSCIECVFCAPRSGMFVPAMTCSNPLTPWSLCMCGIHGWTCYHGDRLSLRPLPLRPFPLQSPSTTITTITVTSAAIV